MKTSQILFLIPVATIAAIRSRMDVTPSGILWLSEFWTSTSPVMQKGYFVSIGVWVAGLIIGVIFRIIQYHKLMCIMRGNIPVSNESYLYFIDTYKEKFRLRKVRVFQNDLLNFPITVRCYRPLIILPVKSYTEKELHMILEHEMNHIRNRDLLWKKIGLFNTFLHWWNPFVYILLKKLILQEEIECDIKTCENNSYFTMKEYGLYLCNMDENYDDLVFVSALCKSKRDLFRRLESMAECKKYKKWIAMVSCMLLLLVSVVPSYAASEGIISLNENWIDNTEVENEAEQIDFKSIEVKGIVQDDEHITEIDLSADNSAYSLNAEVSLDYTVRANTRVLYRWQEMQAGDQVFVTASCSDSSIVYRIGIKNNNNTVRYIQGTGTLSHIFETDEDGEYTVYVENRSSTAMAVTGRASYPN